MRSDVESDRAWIAEQAAHGWKLPLEAHWTLRLPIVRRVRAGWMALRVYHWHAICARMGLVPSGYDEWVLYAVARGWC